METKKKYPQYVGMSIEEYSDILRDPEKRLELVSYYFESSVEIAGVRKQRDTVYKELTEQISRESDDLKKIDSAIHALKNSGELSYIF